MKIVCIGAGYVGGPSMAVLASQCPDITVVVVDINAQRIDAWNSDNLPIYERGLEEVVRSCRGKNLFFSTDTEKHVANGDVIFVSVNTPTKRSGIGGGKAADLTYWERSARLIATVSTSSKIVVEKSTVPVRAADVMASVLQRNCQYSSVHFEILSNPEFLAEGTAVSDLLHPDRVLLGGAETDSGKRAVHVLKSVYQRWIPSEKILTTSLWSAELSKLASNAFLAQRISSINSISALCEVSGADIQQVAHAVGMDSRIGSAYLNASVGFGGSCFQKDLLNLIYICETLGLQEVADYWNQVVKMNRHQKSRFVYRVVSSMFNTVNGKKVAIFGFSFKKNTGDSRASPAVDICQGLINDGAKLAIYDPKVPEKQISLDLFPSNAQRSEDFAGSLSIMDCPYKAAENADAICLLTNWDEFRSLDYHKAWNSMRKPAFIFDGPNLLDLAALKSIGFIPYGVGKPLDPYHCH